MPTGALKAIPENIAKEWVSLAYVQALAAQVGLNTTPLRWDDGVDLQIGSTKPVLPDFDWRHHWIAIQLKSTENWEVKDGRIAFFLKRSNYDQLRARSLCGQYLVLYTLPFARSRWIRQQTDHLDFCSKAYYMNLDGEPDLNPRHGRDRTGKTVKFNVANVLTAGTLRRLYVEEAIKAKKRYGL